MTEKYYDAYPPPHNDGLTIRGFFRLNIVDGDSGEIVGDSGWHENTVTNEGKLGYLVKSLGSIANSSYLSYAGIGEGTDTINAASTVLTSECSGTSNEPQRATLTMASSGSTALRCTGTFSSADSFVTATESIAEIGLFRSVGSDGGTLFAGNTFDSSSCATNQNVNFTYDITFT